jgi:hypothetical protein
VESCPFYAPIFYCAVRSCALDHYVLAVDVLRRATRRNDRNIVSVRPHRSVDFDGRKIVRNFSLPPTLGLFPLPLFLFEIWATHSFPAFLDPVFPANTEERHKLLKPVPGPIAFMPFARTRYAIMWLL